MLRLSSVALTAVLIVPTYTGSAQERVEAGALQCRGSTTSFVVGSVTELNCTFVPSAGSVGVMAEAKAARRQNRIAAAARRAPAAVITGRRRPNSFIAGVWTMCGPLHIENA